MNKRVTFLLATLLILLVQIIPFSHAMNQQTHSPMFSDCFTRFDWEWSPLKILSTESDPFANTGYPSIDTDSRGNVHIAWIDETEISGSGTDKDVVYKRWNAADNYWSTTYLVSYGSDYNSQDVSIVIDSALNVHFIWHDSDLMTFSSIYHKYWNVTSLSWSDTNEVSTESTGYAEMADSAIDAFDNIHVAWADDSDILGSGTDVDIFYKKWDSSSLSWGTTQLISSESNDGQSEGATIAVDSLGDVHIAWRDLTDYDSSGSDADIFYKKWDESSSSWATTEVISTISSSITSQPSITTDGTNSIHLIWSESEDYQGAGTDTDIFYRKWDSSSLLWGTEQVVSTGSTSSSSSSVIAVDSMGTVHVAWHDYSNDYGGSGSDVDINYASLDYGLANWSTTQIVSTEGTGSSDWLDLAVDYAGIVHIVWQDTSDIDGFGTDYDIFYKKLSNIPDKPDLAFIVPNPNEDGSIYLDWDSVLGATNYYIYRSDSYIWTIEDLAPIQSTTDTHYTDTLPSTGIYYYVIIAENYVGNSSASNCRYIEYKLPSLNEFFITFGIVSGTALVLTILPILRKKKKV